MAILRDDNWYPEFAGNRGHIYNPQQTVFYSPKGAAGTNAPGMGHGNPGSGVGRSAARHLGHALYHHDWTSDYDTVFTMIRWLRCIKVNHPGAPPLLTPGKAVVWSFGPTKTYQRGRGTGRRLQQAGRAEFPIAAGPPDET